MTSPDRLALRPSLAPRPPLAPGLALAGVAALVATGLSWAAGAVAGLVVSPMVLALLLGAVLGSSGRRPAAGARGLAWTTTHVLRAGVVLLGLRLSAGQVLDLGWRGTTVIAVTVCATFAGTLLVSRALGVSRLTGLYVATGFSICGAVAIAAMAGTVRPGGAPGATAGTAATAGSVAPGAPERDAEALGTALALVTIYGSLAILVLPWLVTVVGLDDAQAGLWIGASVQEVAQVVAAAGVVSSTALAAATVAKLARVVLLAPLTAGAALVGRARREALGEPGLGLALPGASAPGTSGAPGAPGASAPARRRPPAVPGFVLGFLAAVLLRSTGLLPDALLGVADHLSTAALTAAMFALGTGVDVRRLVATGARPLALGAVSTALAAGTSLVAVLVLT